MKTAILITTKNRRADLARALRSCLIQTVQAEIWVVDDASTDDTAAMVAAEFPEVRLLRSETSLGCVVQRGRVAHMIDCDIIVSLDDDGEYTSNRVLEQTLAAFTDDKIGAVTIPWRNMYTPDLVYDRAPDSTSIWLTRSYTGVAHALRRELFLRLGAYRDFLVHAAEEDDYCIRMLAAGYFVRLGYSDPVNHYVSPVRNAMRQEWYAARNSILFAWYYAPLQRLPAHVVATIFNNLRTGFKRSSIGARLRGLLAGLVLCAGAQRFARKPISPEIYRLHRRLTRAGATRMTALV